MLLTDQIPEGIQVEFPYNPNGSMGNIAGICDPSGQVLGLMPHPERYQFNWQHPTWTLNKNRNSYTGLNLFKNAINALAKN